MTVLDNTETPVLSTDPSAAELRALLDAQRRAAIAEGIPGAEVRLDRVDRFVAGVLEYAEEISAALDADFGSRPRLANLMSDIIGGVGALADVRANLESWMGDRPLPGTAETGTPSFVQVRPKGVVGVIGPWNFPVGLVVHPAIEALAAGNRVMIKFSDIPERTAEVFARAVASRMREEEVAVVRGGLETARAFSDLPFDHLFFTGSPAVGAHVAEAAGRNLVPVTLELGGKNPVVIAAGADLTKAAERIAGFRLTNGGQICLCPDYVFVPRGREDAFVAAYERAVRAYFPGYLTNRSVVSIIDERNFDRVNGLIEDAVAKGARAVTIADRGELAQLPDRRSRRIAPTVLLGVTPEMAIATEEIFGPVIVVYGYDDSTEAVDYINRQPSPLAAYWFGDDDAEFRHFLAHTTSGGVTRNDIALHWGIPGAPSGGIGRSGMGAYHGETGFLTFSHLRTVAASELPVGVMAGALPPAGEAEADGIAALIGQTRTEIEARVAGRPRS
ncbi:aldehyde dehydrogenase family protein [Nocardia harenae]|uniref:aldehyde dehydrogenase family protein n=1 Tax=Nocardia harenae TaxID=358707 RepID=UPI0008335D9D|nr:aldehyde dehydrogenase family protein [Nocardia harenae]